jgi:acetyltransferase-like isoleucine patch superfamily enzyme
MAPLSRLLHRLFVALENSERKRLVAGLRSAGHQIPRSTSFGRRVQLDVHASAAVRFGERVRILQDCWLMAEDGDTLDIGDDVFVSQHCTISGTIRIGRDTLIAGYVTIIDANHVIDRCDVPVRSQGGRKAPIRIGEDVWIGTGSVILPGVSIGDHAVVGANSTVTHDVPPHAIVGGSPARLIRMRGAS